MELVKLSASVDMCPSLVFRAIVRKGVVCTTNWEGPLSLSCKGVRLEVLCLCQTTDWRPHCPLTPQAYSFCLLPEVVSSQPGRGPGQTGPGRLCTVY